MGESSAGFHQDVHAGGAAGHEDIVNGDVVEGVECGGSEGQGAGFGVSQAIALGWRMRRRGASEPWPVALGKAPHMPPLGRESRSRTLSSDAELQFPSNSSSKPFYAYTLQEGQATDSLEGIPWG